MKSSTPFIHSYLGKKFLVAATGVILFGFLIGHAAGNLKVFAPDHEGIPSIDHYGEFLRVVGEPLVPKYFLLWTARLILLAALVIHVVLVVQLQIANRAARPQRYQRTKYSAATWSARMMMASGIFILGFVIFHILHFTTGTIQIGTFEHGKVYSNLYSSFGSIGVVLFYVSAMVVLAFHLFHGVWSLFQTWGIDSPDRNRFLRGFAIVTTLGVATAFSLVPISFMTGMMGEPPVYHSVETMPEDSDSLADQRNVLGTGETD